MLYLIKSYIKGGKSILKVGFSDDLQKRLSLYYHSNPGFEFIGSRKGTLNEEKKLQLYLEHLGYKYKKLQEWFIPGDNKIFSRFHDHWEIINKYLWKNRDKLLRLDISSDKRYREIYEELREKFGHIKQTEIDKEYNKNKNLEILKQLRNNTDLLD